MSITNLSQRNAFTLDKKTWGNSKADATRAAINIKNSMGRQDRKQLDDIALDVQHYLNNGTLDNTKLNKIINQLHVIGLKAEPAHEFLHNIIIVVQHSSGRYKIHNFFGHTLKTNSLKNFLKGQLPKTKTSFYSFNGVEEHGLVDAILLSKVAHVYHDVSLYSRANKCFEEFLKGHMHIDVRNEVTELYNANIESQLNNSGKSPEPTPARLFLKNISKSAERLYR